MNRKYKLVYRLTIGAVVITVFGSGLKTSFSGPYLNSIHGSPTSGVQRSNLTTFSKGNCVHCHEMHASIDGSEPQPVGGAPSLWALLANEENACFYCHGSSSQNNPPLSKNIQTLFTNTYRHPTTDYSGRHKKSQFLETGSDLGQTNRHAECVDCHNPHAVKSNTHTYNSTSPASNNLVSGALLGVFGVDVSSWPTNWTVPTTFTELRPTASNPSGGAQKEYQICFKCHSYYALQDADGITSWNGPSGVLITDQAREFNPNNYSIHPVVVGLNNRTGGYTPRALTTSQMNTPWTNVGTQTMYCSDCHGAYAWDATGTQVKGPHGTSNKFMLIEGRTWPQKTATCNGNPYWTLSDVRNNQCNWQTQLLCAKCHVIYSNNQWKNNAHQAHAGRNFTCGGGTTGVPCIACHVAVPHGSKHSRLIAYVTDPTPIKDACAALNGFCKANTPTGYSRSNCYSATSGCTTHSNQGGQCPNGAYDPQ